MGTASTTLVLQAATPQIAGGLLQDGRWRERWSLEKPPLAGLDQIVRAALRQTEGALGTVAVCVGPGSQLGVRLAMMTARGLVAGTRSPPEVLAFRSFDLAAAWLLARRHPTPFRILSAYRSRAWLIYDVPQGIQMAQLALLPVLESTTDDVPIPVDYPVWRIPQSKVWREPPATVQEVDLGLDVEASLFSPGVLLRPEAELLRSLPANPDYVRWSGERHGATS